MTEPIRGFLFDLDGVLATGGHPLPGAVDTLRALQARRIPFAIVSNATLVPRTRFAELFAQHGLNVPVSAMVTPPAAAARWLRAQATGQPVAAFVSPATRAEFDGLWLQPLDADSARSAAFVVIGDMGDEWNARELNRALRLLLGGARLLSLGMGRYWRGSDGLRLDCGAYASALAYASGQNPLVFGKPAAEFFQLALDLLALPPTAVVMVGDDVVTDVAAAQGLGIRGVLVQTGKFRPADLEQGLTPDWVLPDVRRVLGLI